MSKRFRDNQKVGDIIKDIVSNSPLEQGINQVQIEQTWNEVMGNGIKNYTSNITLKKDKLFISLSSSIVRDQLSFGKSKIIDMLNEALGKEVVKEIVLR